MAALAESSALSLPPRLINFFAKYPPRLYGMHFTGATLPTISQKIAREGNKKTGEAPHVIPASKTTATTTPESISQSTAPTAPAAAVDSRSQPQAASISADATPTSPSAQFSTPISPLLDPDTAQPIFDSTDKPPNPFLPYRNPATGRWRGAIISLRRQAELFKLARHYGVEPLLPASRKSSAFKEARLLERGTRAGVETGPLAGPEVKGTGPGQQVKGHKWERGMGVTLQKRITAMEKMPELIREWRMRGNGRGWKRYPK